LDVPELLAQSDIFVLSSHWEGLPISIIEAMRAGLPVVASDVGGVSESVIDGVTGLISHPRDVNHLRECLQILIDSPELIAKMGQTGRESFYRDFRIEGSIKKTLEVYESVCESPGRVPLFAHGKEAQ
jgi:glycosyltransferase involved in cell wall biosynthesis